MERRKRGDETWNRLLAWTEAQKASERLAGHILRSEGYSSIDPSHPLGGPDGLKDLVCIKGNIRWIAAAYFPRGEQTFKEIQEKLNSDLQGATLNEAQGFAFVTNQYIQLADRNRLAEAVLPIQLDLLHLERIVSILDSPPNYGIRLEFLDIQMSKEEQVSFFAYYATSMDQFRAQVQAILNQLSQPDLSKAIPVQQLQAFKATLESIVGPSGFYPSIFQHPMDRLKVPLQELREFETILNRLTGGQFPQLAYPKPPLQALHSLPLDLMQLNESLDQIIWKLNQINKLKSGL
jgi:hypothetical protein